MNLNEIEPATLDLQPIRIGSAWEWELELFQQDIATGIETPLELDNAEAQLQLRRTAKTPTALLSLSNADGIALSGGKVAVSVSSEMLADLQACGSAEWDLRLRFTGGDWWYPARGVVSIEQGVTR